jgi:hypothetical protein
MKSTFAKWFGLLGAAALFASPMLLSAKHHSSSHENEHHCITYKDVAGTYQISGFSNSLDGGGTLLQPQSNASTGQLTLYKNGMGVLNFVDAASIVNNTLQSLHLEGIEFTYTVGPIDGYGAINFTSPFPGTGAISFKKHEGKVVGFSSITTSQPGSLWGLLQADRFD